MRTTNQIRRQSRGRRARRCTGGRGWAVVALLLLALAGPAQTSAQTHRAAGGTWVATGYLTTTRAYQSATLLPNGQVLLAGGTFSGSSLADLASVEIYNPQTGVFTANSSMTTAREQQTATLLRSGKVLIAGGAQQQAALGSAELYDPHTGTFTSTATGIGVNIVGQTATLLHSGAVLLAGGCSGTGIACQLTYARAEVYDPRTETFTPTGSMTTPRLYHTATLLPNGTVLIAGGATCDACYPLASAELYNPATGTFSPTGSMHTPRAFHTATLLPNGTVLVAGGCTNQDETCDPASSTLASAEIYNPATGTWRRTGSMTVPRYDHTATLLRTGQVLVAGGANGSGIIGAALANAELYNPRTGTWTATASMLTARDIHTATLLPSGAVLVAGGCTSFAGHCTSYPTAKAELYVP